MANFHITFAASYWYHNLGMTNTCEALSDPEKQRQNAIKRQAHLAKKWRELGLAPKAGGAPDDPAPTPTVAGYGTATVAMILGCQGVFQAAHDPYTEPLELTDEQIMALCPAVDYRDNPVMQELERQASWLVKKYGKARLAINMQSVPNIAFKLRGEQLMYDFYENPALVHKLLDYIQQSWVNIRNYIAEVNEKNGVAGRGNLVTLDNCNVALLSPDIYREFFLPYDQKNAAYYRDNFGVHHCGGNMQLFSKMYGSLGEAKWFDIGYGSDIAQCMRELQGASPKPHWSVRYGPAQLLHGAAAAIGEEKNKIASLGADTVACIGVDPQTPAANIKAFLAV